MVSVGIDEVGRGAWAGPLVAGAVILGPGVEGLADSKVLSKKSRETLDSQIRQWAVFVGLGWVSAREIDELGLSNAVGLAMTRAVAAVAVPYDEIIIDGSINYLSSNPKARALVKADASIPSVSAASIVAKVARDNYMDKLSEKYPAYGFNRHVGYGTAFHLSSLRRYGVSDIHRLSFKPIQALIT